MSRGPETRRSSPRPPYGRLTRKSPAAHVCDKTQPVFWLLRPLVAMFERKIGSGDADDTEASLGAENRLRPSLSLTTAPRFELSFIG